MSCTYSRLVRIVLVAALVFGGIVTHAGSVVHAGSVDVGGSHRHLSPAASLLVQHAGSIDLSEPGTDTDGPSHALGLCLDAHCCTPAVHMAAQSGLRHLLERGKLVIAASPDYALSVAYSLLRPPRAIA